MPTRSLRSPAADPGGEAPGLAEALRRIERARSEGSTRLHLTGLKLTTLPEALWELTTLQTLFLFNNLLNTLPEELGQLKALQTLDLSHNRLTTLPEALGKLTALQKLYLHNNQLTTLPPALGMLTALQRLGLHDNQLTLPDALGRLTALEWLNLNNNRLKTVPEAIGKLTALQELLLGSNQLTDLPKEMGELKALQKVDLEDNRFTTFPAVLAKLPTVALFLHGNPGLGLPEEVLGPKWDDPGKAPARAEDILTYYFKVREGARPLNEVKMLLVGRGEAGKSSIRDRLLGLGFTPHRPETLGIQIDPWRVTLDGETVRLHVWDFAGQELTHGTHQFFLTERSIYILVLDARSDTQDRDAEYWLQLIKAFGGDSPVIVALNKSDAKPFNVDRIGICERCAAVRAFVETDCETGRGLEALEKEICAAIAEMESVREPFPSAWSQTKDACSEMKESYLTLAAFRETCARHGTTNPEEQEALARILHRLGIVLHYADDPRLRDTAVLKPHWVTESIYRLLRLKEGPQSDGSLTLAEARAALPGETPEMVRYLIGLMRRFELCFPVDETDEHWLVPELLPRFQPTLGSEWRATATDALRLRYRYQVLPEGLLPRFITRTYPLSAEQTRWRAGVVLAMDDARALVRSDPASAQVQATILGGAESRSRLAKLIRNHFAHIHADLKSLEPEEEIEPEGAAGRFKSVALLELDERNCNVTTIDTPEGSKPLDKTRELNRISAPAARNPRRRRLRSFLSYSHKDSGLRDVFQENLALLEADGLLEAWFDGQILPGADYDTVIRRELEQADLILFLVSTPFLASTYIRGVEMRRALQRREAGEAELVSVIVDNSAFDGRAFTKYQLVQPGNLAASDLRRRRSGFNKVEKALRRLIEDILARGGGIAQGG